MDTFATEKDRYKEVYLSTGNALLNFARKFVPEFYAEDIVHDVFLRFWDKQIYKLPDEELRSLLYTAVRNACIDHLRKLQTEQEFIDQHVVQLTLEEICLYESSEEKIMKQDLFLQFLKQSEALPEQLGLSVHAVENQLYRALLYLRKHCAWYLYIFLC
ncbi:MAG: sigma factor [Macellibacteroides fermentans]|uniref:sigma factor n=1 Tax=Macellibacteroides fermentans TaxID=879969 RepID=UPI003ACFD44B